MSQPETTFADALIVESGCYILLSGARSEYRQHVRLTLTGADGRTTYVWLTPAEATRLTDRLTAAINHIATVPA